MKRAIIFALALACCSTDPVPFIPPQGNISLTMADPWITAIRGSSVTAHVVLAVVGDPGKVTVSFGVLPDGLSSSATTWIALESPSVPLTITASADAPELELNVEVHASANGVVLASTIVHLTVSGVVGSVDGFFSLASEMAEPMRIGQTTSGDFVVTGWSGSAMVCAQRVLADGPTPTFVASGTSATSPSAGAISDTGLAAAAADGKGPNQLVEFDAIQGSVVTMIAPPFPVTAISFDGTSLFYACETELFYTATGMEADINSSMTSLETIAPGVVLAGAHDPIYGNAELVTFTASSTEITAGIAHTLPKPYEHVTNTITRAGTILAGLTSPDGDVAVARVDAQGNVLDLREVTGEQWANARLVALPNGEPLLLGTRVVLGALTSATIGVAQSFTPDFGVLGRAVVRLDGPTTVIDGVVDATGAFLYVTGTTGNTLHSYVARIRLQ